LGEALLAEIEEVFNAELPGTKTEWLANSDLIDFLVACGLSK
jgi:hypothetical protein